MEGLAIHFRESLIAFAELYELVLADIRKRLARVAGRPPDFHRYDACGFAEAEVLFVRCGAERSSAAYGSEDIAGGSRVVYRYFDTGSDRGAIRFDADEMNADPVISVAGIFEQPRVVLVARHRATHH